MDFAIPTDQKIKLKENEKRDKYLDLTTELKKTLEHKSDGDTNWNLHTRYRQQRIVTGMGGFGNKEDEY